MNRIAALLLTVLALLAPAGALRGDSTIWVNSTADTVAVDNVVTLREALLHARRGGIFDDGSVGISCMTEAEWYQMFGDIENCVRIASPTLAGCVHNPVTDGVRYAFMNDCFYNQSGPGMGLNFADVIRFDPAISAIAIPGDFWVFRRDRLDGSRPAAAFTSTNDRRFRSFGWIATAREYVVYTIGLDRNRVPKSANAPTTTR